MKVVVSGSRYWTYEKHADVIRRFLKRLPPDTTLLNGGQKGVDTICAVIGKELNFYVPDAFMADWNKYYLAAGPIRNKKMLDQNPDVVLLFHDDILKSKGTKNMKSQCEKMKIKWILIVG